MVLACFRHPCTLCLGVLAPKLSFIYGPNYLVANPNLGRGTISDEWGTTMTGGGNRTITMMMRLAGLACVQVLVRLIESLMIQSGRMQRRDSTSIKVADFVVFIMDGVFVVWMVHSLYDATFRTIGEDYGRGHALSKSGDLLYYWILYGIFVTVSVTESLLGALHFVTNILPVSEHFIYMFYMVHGVNDLLLLTGIAVLMRPQVLLDSPDAFDISTENDLTTGLDVGSDYALLLEDGSDMQDEQSDEEGLMTNALELTTNSTSETDRLRSDEFL